MTSPAFLLTKKLPITLYRAGQGSVVNYEWVAGAYEALEEPIYCNVQPAKHYEVIQNPNADFSKGWVKIFTTSLIRQKKESQDGYGGDRFYWEDDLYEIRKVKTWKMGILDHYVGLAVRVEITPDEVTL